VSSPESERIRAALINDRDSLHVPLEVQRREWEEMAARVPALPGVALRPLALGGVPCEMLSGAGAVDGCVFFYLHGGGFSAGSPRTHRDLAARLALAAGIAVLLVDYRLAPEHPFPAAIEDARSAYGGLIDSGIDPGHIFAGGDSAGGGLAVSTLLCLREMGMPLPRAAVLLSAWADLALAGESIDSRAHLDPLTSREGLRLAAGLYLGQHSPRDPLVSPVHADFHGLPPMLIQAGDHEILLSDSVRLAGRAREAGVDARLDVWPEMWHVWHAWAAELPEARAALARIGEYVRQHL
jgi:acetyl esterase/lipase